MCLPLSLYTAQIPGLITWFNGFIGYREIQKRTERVEMKLKDVGVIVPALARKYYFHSTYKKLAIRNRTYAKINVDEADNHRAVSLIAAVRNFASLLDLRQQERLRARIIESLDPDRDIRELEHEMRAFVHYRGAGCKILPSDENQNGRFDFLVNAGRGGDDFELECKTFAEDIGNPISIADSVHVFAAFRSAIAADSNFRESGILTVHFPARVTTSEQELRLLVSDFLCKGCVSCDYGQLSLTFERKIEWDTLLRTGRREDVLDDIATRFVEHNRHTMTMISREQAIMGVVRSDRDSRPANAVFGRLKSASEQFSRKRPAVIWGHFLGFGEDDFRELLEERRFGQRTFDVFGNYLFKNPNRNYICRLRLSADGNLNRLFETSKGVLRREAVSGGGLAYDLTSKVSKFDATLTV